MSVRHIRSHLQRFQILVDARGCLVMDSTFIAYNSCLHTYNIVHRTFLPIRIAFRLHFGSLQIVARVVFVRNGKRNNVELLQLFEQCAFCSQCKHLENGLLCKVVGVLGTSFSLCYPQVFVLFFKSKYHIARHLYACQHQFSRRQPALHDETLAESCQVAHPR